MTSTDNHGTFPESGSQVPTPTLRFAPHVAAARLPRPTERKKTLPPRHFVTEGFCANWVVVVRFRFQRSHQSNQVL